jgi:hypothetical protein
MSNDTSTERWLPVVGYEGVYAVSDHGRVMRLAGSERVKKNRILAARNQSNGYLATTLWLNGNYNQQLIHRLVMQSFVGDCPKGITVNHKDGNKRNNHLSNLEYATQSENNKHAFAIGLKISQDLSGESNPRAKITQVEVDEIRRLHAQGGISYRALGRQFNVTGEQVSYIVRRISWK